MMIVIRRVDHVESSDESSQNYGFETIEDIRLFFLNTGSRAVSYTHLDVYKRQDLTITKLEHRHKFSMHRKPTQLTHHPITQCNTDYQLSDPLNSIPLEETDYTMN